MERGKRGDDNRITIRFTEDEWDFIESVQELMKFWPEQEVDRNDVIHWGLFLLKQYIAHDGSLPALAKLIKAKADQFPDTSDLAQLIKAKAADRKKK